MATSMYDERLLHQCEREVMDGRRRKLFIILLLLLLVQAFSSRQEKIVNCERRWGLGMRPFCHATCKYAYYFYANKVRVSTTAVMRK